MLERVRALPGAAPLLDALAELDGSYLVGGVVRDLLLGAGTPTDFDVVVDGDAVAAARRLGGALQIHDRFGTSTAELDGARYDFARARSETYERPGALPEVEPAGIEVDLGRRDFTVNAIAVALGGARAGELVAVPPALEDLEARRLRVLHDGSFIDDPTRLLRLARYAGRLGFAVAPETRELARQALHSDALATVSGPRIGAELRLLAREPDPVGAFEALRELEIDRAIEPSFGLADPELARRALGLLGAEGRRDLAVLAAAFRQVPATVLNALLDRLAFEARDRDTIVAGATRGDEIAAALERSERPSEIAEAVAGAGSEAVALAGALGPAEAARDWLTRLRHVRLEIDGNDLLAAGVPEGQAVGSGLAAALAAKLDGRADGREAELTRALAATRDAPT
jgi:tRNA nucleotidyltransferase (CCA-adding enzyme)